MFIIKTDALTIMLFEFKIIKLNHKKNGKLL